MPHVVLRDEAWKTWLHFTSPCEIVTTNRIDDILPLLRILEEKVAHDKLYAAGFISYEAAPAFDPSLPAKIDKEFPLLWFGLFKQADEITLPPSDRSHDAFIPWQPSITQEEYRTCLGKIRKFIRDGDTYQVNFTYRLQAKTDRDPWQLFLHIAGDEPPFAAFLETDDWAICSASPELFLKLDGEQIESRPMKGTAARGLWFEEDQAKQTALRNSGKEQAENLMIVDMVRNDLGRVAHCGSVHVPSLFGIEKYQNMWQMTSTVRGQTHESLDRIFQATFPPASITGAPKRRTMEIIAELESSPRRVYTGTIGFITPERRAQFNVAIRTVLLHKTSGQTEYGVGSGIVWDSKPGNEYAECLTKTRVLRPVARDFELLETMLWSPSGGYRLLEYHLKRLAQSADYFDFPADLQKIRKKLSDLTATFPPKYHRIRLLLSCRGRLSCEAVPVKHDALGFTDIVLAANPVDKQDTFLYHKTTSRRLYENALKMRPGNNDVLLFNENDEITESTVANIAVEINGALCTPPISCGLLPGTQRAWMIDHARLEERIITVQEVLDSPNIYLLNSVRGMHKIRVQTHDAAKDFEPSHRILF